jgi:hypothetical protein
MSVFDNFVVLESHSRNVSRYGNTFMALLNFIASKDSNEFCIEDICSSSDIIFDISSEKKPAFVIDFFKFSRVL